MMYRTPLRWVLLVAFCATSFPFSSGWALSDSTLCKELCRYRDVELSRQYDAAFDSYVVSVAHMQMLQDERKDLMSNPQWSTSDARLATAELLVVVKTTCDLMIGIVKLNPATTIPARALSAGQLKALDIAEKSVLGVEVVQTAVDQGIESSAYKQMVAELNPILLAIKTLDDFKSGLDKMAQLGIDRDQLRTEVSRVFDLVNASLEKHNRIMQNNKMRLQDLNEVVQGITDFILKNDCSRYCTNSQENAKERKEDKATGGSVRPVAVEEALGPGQFYVFLSYSESYDDIYSWPVRASGFEDPLSKAKETFASLPKNSSVTFRVTCVRRWLPTTSKRCR
ncbi:MAG: hypothetical protein IPF41_10035 [Flavobacteriales bacterium]|nr:hypothetical protein [Flavobacteriales bacterium]